MIRRSRSADWSVLITTDCHSPSASHLVPKTSATVFKSLFWLNGVDVQVRRYIILKIVRDSLCRGCLNQKVDP